MSADGGGSGQGPPGMFLQGAATSRTFDFGSTTFHARIVHVPLHGNDGVRSACFKRRVNDRQVERRGHSLVRDASWMMVSPT
jgi:hypothetical protein